MDGRDAPATSGSGMSSFYIQHREMGDGNFGSPPGLQGSHPTFCHLNSTSGFSFQPPEVGGSSNALGFHVERPPAVSPGAGGKGLNAVNPNEQVKRKRGRPRKIRPEGATNTGLLRPSVTRLPLGSGVVSVATPGSGPESAPGSMSATQSEKRRGRPPGSGKMQQLASLGNWFLDSVGTGFTPHIIIIQSGEDVAARIMALSQQGPRAVCILSASGALSEATLRQSDSSGDVVTYEGRYQIVCLSGSYILLDDGVTQTRSGGLCIALCGADQRSIGGSVGGPLKAAGVVQVIVGSFMYTGPKKNKIKAEGEDAELNSENKELAMLPNQNFQHSPTNEGWPGQMRVAPGDVRPSKIDINSTRE